MEAQEAIKLIDQFGRIEIEMTIQANRGTGLIAKKYIRDERRLAIKLLSVMIGRAPTDLEIEELMGGIG